MKLTICNLCGKDFDEDDRRMNASFVYTVGRFGAFEGMTLELDLCCACHDKLLLYLADVCEIAPFKSNTGEL